MRLYPPIEQIDVIGAKQNSVRALIDWTGQKRARTVVQCGE